MSLNIHIAQSNNFDIIVVIFITHFTVLSLFVLVFPPKISVDEISKMGFPGAEEIAKLFDYYQRGNINYDLMTTRHLEPGTKTFEEWVVANKTILEEAFTDD